MQRADSWEETLMLGKIESRKTRGRQRMKWLHGISDSMGIFGRNDAKAETPVLWPPHVKSWLIGKDSDAGRDWGQDEKGTTEDEMAGWRHWVDGRESKWNPGVGNGQGGLACCDSWGRKESDMTEWLNWTELNWCFNMLTNMEQQEDGCIFLRSNYFKNKKKNQCETTNLSKQH